MIEIQNNQSNLKLSEIEKFVNKVRAIIIDDNRLIVCRYADMFMLPGGKKEDRETDIEALQREIKEELGIIINDNAKEIVEVSSFLPNYYDRKSGLRFNRLTKTKYFLVEKNNIMSYTNTQLTSDEVKCGFKAYIFDIDDLKSIVENYKSRNEKYEVFKTELMEVLEIISDEKKLRRKI